MLSVSLHAFWIKMLQDVFQMWMDQITNRLPGIIAIHDDICVYGNGSTEHDNNLLKLIKQLKNKVWFSIAVSVPSANPKFPFMVLYL